MSSKNYHVDEADPLFSHLTENEVDDALNFDLDFDAIAESMGDALPHINLDEMGSLGTRSPSPSESARSSAVSVGSKRSRAEFDSESECDSVRYVMAKRMVFQTEPELSLSLDQLYRDGDYSTKVIQRDREREGRCHQCGLETHKLINTSFGVELQPLTIEGEVLNGRCLLCDPLTEGETTQKLIPSRKPNDIDDGPEPGRARRIKHPPPPPPRGNNAGPQMSNRPPFPSRRSLEAIREIYTHSQPISFQNGIREAGATAEEALVD